MVFALLLMILPASAHYLWVESAAMGRVGKAQSVKVFFGEYTYGVVEDPNGEHFPAVANFKVWAISPSGKMQKIETAKAVNCYEGSFVPNEKGTYTLVLDNNEIEVIDYTKYDFGIFKTHYHSTARVEVGNEVISSAEDTNPDGLAIVDLSSTVPSQGREVILQVLYKGESAKDLELSVYVKDMWSKKLKTDETGQVKFALPWDTKYTVEVTMKEEVPGTFKGKAYEFIWHCATYCIQW